ncbi:hypothetical protein COLO4_04205 [Corchorus olitorius]|uniref:lipid-A-disaccharide synthase n=1 Tax=Corchorus olitorius TaxID=93759 RepID=A0A1R3KUT7_9ROSI|nr:hypothetical protein COLO4_04205 [Corchorus olitorius]
MENIAVKLKETVEAAFHFNPHVVVTVDSKGFSFRLLKQLRGTVAMELQLARELMSNKALQEQQIVAAKNVMELISPSNRTGTNLAHPGMMSTPPIYTPSMIAASTILSYARR